MGVVTEPTKGKVGKKAELFFFIQNFIENQFTANKMTEDSESNAEKGVVVINGNGNSSTANTTALTAAAEKPDITTETQKQQLQPTGLSQSSKDDIGVCVVIISITILAIIITVIKIVLFDISAYPELFGRSDTSNTTTQNT